MSSTDAPTTPPAATDNLFNMASVFTDKEKGLLAAAMMSLKSGPPEIDMAKFQQNGNFNTTKTAQNTWGTMKKKLIAMSPATEGDSGSAPVTPQKNGAKVTTTPNSKKRNSDGEADDEGERTGSPKKKAAKAPRKTPVKKVIAGSDEAEGGSPTPKASRKTNASPAGGKKKLSESKIIEEGVREMGEILKSSADDGKVGDGDVKMEGDEE